MKTIVLAALLLVAAAAQAQVYKCTEGGKVVYTQIPCQAHEPEMDLKVHRLSAEELRQVERRAEIDREVARQKSESPIRRLAEQRAAEAAAAPAKPDYCDQLRADHSRATRLAEEYVHPDNIAREKARAKKAESDSFFRCPPDRRISTIFD